MEATESSEAVFQELNGQRLSILKTLLSNAQRATELCDLWLASGHIADYRAWQIRVRDIDVSEDAYQKLKRNA